MDAPPVQYVKTSDGYDIAYCVSDRGAIPLLFVPPPLSDVEAMWELSPHWLEGFAERFRLIQYDRRGEGLSSRNLPEGLSQSDFLRDMEAVVDRIGVRQFLIWAWAVTCHDAIRYALAHPERVLGLILNQPTASNAVWMRAQYTALPRDDWETFLYILAGRGLEPGVHSRRLELIRNTTTFEDWVLRTDIYKDLDVEADLASLHSPTLVLSPQARVIPGMTEVNRKVAALIPGSRFVRIDGQQGTVNFMFGDPVEGFEAIDAFVSDLPPPGERPGVPELAAEGTAGLSERELEVLRLIAQGKSNPEIATELFITRNTVQNHVSSILTKLNLQNRAQAAVYAQQHGIV